MFNLVDVSTSTWCACMRTAGTRGTVIKEERCHTVNVNGSSASIHSCDCNWRLKVMGVEQWTLSKHLLDHTAMDTQDGMYGERCVYTNVTNLKRNTNTYPKRTLTITLTTQVQRVQEIHEIHGDTHIHPAAHRHPCNACNECAWRQTYRF